MMLFYIQFKSVIFQCQFWNNIFKYFKSGHTAVFICENALVLAAQDKIRQDIRMDSQDNKTTRIYQWAGLQLPKGHLTFNGGFEPKSVC